MLCDSTIRAHYEIHHGNGIGGATNEQVLGRGPKFKNAGDVPMDE